MEAGVAGYLLKEAAPNDIRERILLAAAGEPGFPPRHYAALRERIRATHPLRLPGQVPDAPLTAQEEEVLRLLVQGITTAEIATLLDIQPTTVRRHLHNLYEKIGVRTQGAAILWALGRAGN